MTDQQKTMSIPMLAKEWFAALREGVIAVIIMLLLLYPSYIGTVASKAGLKSAFGIEFIQQLEENQKEMSKAQEAVNVITSQLTQLRSQLLRLGAATSKTNQPMAGEIARMTTNVDSLELRSRQIKGSLQTSLRVQEGLIEKGRSNLSLPVRQTP